LERFVQMQRETAALRRREQQLSLTRKLIATATSTAEGTSLLTTAGRTMSSPITEVYSDAKTGVGVDGGQDEEFTEVYSDANGFTRETWRFPK
jgi:hypothetical protein